MRKYYQGKRNISEYYSLHQGVYNNMRRRNKLKNFVAKIKGKLYRFLEQNPKGRGLR